MHDIQMKDIEAESKRRKTLQMRFSSNSVPTVASVQAESKQEEKTEETKDEPKVTESPGWVPV